MSCTYVCAYCGNSLGYHRSLGKQMSLFQSYSSTIYTSLHDMVHVYRFWVHEMNPAWKVSACVVHWPWVGGRLIPVGFREVNSPSSSLSIKVYVVSTNTALIFLCCDVGMLHSSSYMWHLSFDWPANGVSRVSMNVANSTWYYTRYVGNSCPCPASLEGLKW